MLNNDDNPLKGGISEEIEGIGRRAPRIWRLLKNNSGELVAGTVWVAAVVVVGVLLFVGIWLAFVAWGGARSGGFLRVSEFMMGLLCVLLASEGVYLGVLEALIWLELR